MGRRVTSCFIEVLLLTVCWTVGTHAEDWSAYRHDNRRSGCTTESFGTEGLKLRWAWRSPIPPQPAWYGPAKWDAYADVRGLRSMRNYDPVFHVIAAEGRVWFGSSADDTLRCLDLATGQEEWCYTADGPIRIAPTYVAGRVYFGSDDGHAYCLDAADGRLLWKFAPGQRDRLILNNGRPIPLWPVRTGVLVADGTAYFAAGLLPWRPTYLCAVDAVTGQPKGTGRYVRTFSSDVTMEGALLASATRLVVPQGRVPPLILKRATGQQEGPLKKGGGGCFVLLTEDERVIHGPGNKTGWISQSRADTREQIANFPGGRAMVVSKDTAYLLSDRNLQALDRKTGKKKWTMPFNDGYELILAGKTLLVGGCDKVVAVDAPSGDPLWQHAVFGRAFGLAVADGTLLVSTDEGVIYCFRSSVGSERRGESSAPAVTSSGGILLGPQEAARLMANVYPRQPADRITRPRQRETPLLALGPCLRFTSPTEAVVRWETRELCPTRLSYGTNGWSRHVENTRPKRQHEVQLTGLRRNTVYHYTIEVAAGPKTKTTEAYECDTFFNYSLPEVPERPCPYPSVDQKALAATAKKLLSAADVKRGVCVVLGCGDGRLVYELARQSALRVIGLETDASKVAEARKALLRAGLYGSRTTILQVESLKKTNLTGYLADLVIAAHDGLHAEAERLARPGGMIIKRPASVRGGSSSSETASLAGEGSPGRQRWRITRRPQPPGIGVWSHQYGRPDNSSFGGETLAGVTGTDGLVVQWVGRPGPRAQADRNGRKPGPLAAGGRLFVQGLHRIIAISAYNGTILWSLEIPHFERFNVPRDSSNWCADEKHVFAVVRDRCWRINAEDGAVSKVYDVVPADREGWRWDWGYVARPNDSLLLGSALKANTSWTTFWGRTGWYDAPRGPVTYKICSDSLFALDVHTGGRRWAYSRGVILSSTIAATGDRVYFVECRNAKVVSSESRRVGSAGLWQDQFLVALNLETGQPVWERPIDTADGTVTFDMACGEGKLVVVSSVAAEARYYVYAWDAASGEPAWEVNFPWPKNKEGKPIDNHGRHMARPAITSGRVFVRPAVIELATGRISETKMAVAGCGTYAFTTEAGIYRDRNVTLWDFYADRATKWSRLRPDCWLSTIPAFGMVLSPEGGGGCSCGSWMETSLGFIPKGRAEP